MYFSRIRIRPNVRESTSFDLLVRNNGYGLHQLLWDLFPRTEKRPFVYREEIAREQLGKRSDVRGEPLVYMVSSHLPLDKTPLFSVQSKPFDPKIQNGDHLTFKLRANPIVKKKRSGKKNSAKHDVVMHAQRQLLSEIVEEQISVRPAKKADLRRAADAVLKSSDSEAARNKLEAIVRENERFASVLDNSRTDMDRLLSWGLKAFIDRCLEQWLSRKGDRHGFRLSTNADSGFLEFQAESYRQHPLVSKGRKAGFSSVDFDGCLEVTDAERFVHALFNGIGSARAFGCGLLLVRRA